MEQASRKGKTVSMLGAFGLSIGTAIGMLVMMVVAYNYHYMINKYPEDNGGLYTYVKKTFGADQAMYIRKQELKAVNNKNGR